MHVAILADVTESVMIGLLVMALVMVVGGLIAMAVRQPKEGRRNSWEVVGFFVLFAYFCFVIRNLREDVQTLKTTVEAQATEIQQLQKHTKSSGKGD